MRDACLYTPWALDNDHEDFVKGMCFGGEGGPGGGDAGRNRAAAQDQGFGEGFDTTPGGLGVGSGGQVTGPGTGNPSGVRGGGVNTDALGTSQQVGSRSGGGVTINVNPQLISPTTDDAPATPARTGADTTQGQGATRGAARRRSRSGTLLTLGLAETTRKTLLGT